MYDILKQISEELESFTELGSEVKKYPVKYRIKNNKNYNSLGTFKLDQRQAFKVDVRGNPLQGLGSIGDFGITVNPLTYIPEKLAEANEKINRIKSNISQIKDANVRNNLLSKLNPLIEKYNYLRDKFQGIQSAVSQGAKIVSDVKETVTATGQKAYAVVTTAGEKVISSASDALSWIRSKVGLSGYGLGNLGVAPIILLSVLAAIGIAVSALITSLNYLDADSRRELEAERLKAGVQVQETQAELAKKLIEQGVPPEQIPEILKAATPGVFAPPVPEKEKSLIEKTIEPFVQLGLVAIGLTAAVTILPTLIRAVRPPQQGG